MVLPPVPLRPVPQAIEQSQAYVRATKAGAAAITSSNYANGLYLLHHQPSAPPSARCKGVNVRFDSLLEIQGGQAA